MLIAGPNLTIDRTLALDELRPGHVLRASRAAVSPGGKGVNVARVTRSLGGGATLVAFLPGPTGEVVAGLLAEERLELVGVRTAGEIRSASLVVERSGRITVINEPGPAVEAADWEAYEHAVAEALPRRRLLVCIGSLPPGCPPDAYARLVRLARTHGTETLVDASGPALAAALAARPDVVVPNLAEAEAVLADRAGSEQVDPGPDAAERARQAAGRLVERGARCAIVTVGAAGLAIVSDTLRALVTPPPVEARNPVGAGDAFVAAFALARERGEPLERAAVAGAAAAAASVESEEPARVDAARAERLSAGVGLVRLDSGGAAGR